MVRNLEFYKKVYLAFRGKLFYGKLLRQHKINKDTFILIQASDDEEIIKYGNLYMDEFIKNNNLSEFIVVTSNQYKKQLGSDKFSAKIIDCPMKKIDCLICLYCMYQFTKNILVFGIDKPNTNRLSNLTKTGVLTKEEATAIGIYGLSSIKE